MTRATMSSVDTGRVLAALPDCVLEPRTRTPGRPPVVYLHGAAQDASKVAAWGSRHLLREFAAAGCACLGVTVTQLWNNAEAQARIAAAVAWLELERGAVGPPILAGASMGALCALGYALDHPDARAVIAQIPAVDLQQFRDLDTIGARDNIDTAHGVLWPAPLPAGVDPITRAAELAGVVPVQLWVASDDVVTPPDRAQAFADAAGAEFHDVGPLGHSDVAMAATDAAAAVAFALAA